jgi:hypothetical protein
MAKLMRKIDPKNRVMRRYSALPVRYHAVWKIGGRAGEADGEWNEEEVVDGGEAELPASEQQRVEQFVHGCPFPVVPSCLLHDVEHPST